MKWQIIGMGKSALSYRQIVEQIGVLKTCVEQTVKKLKTTDTVLEAPRKGRPRLTSSRTYRKIVNMSKQDRKPSLPDLFVKIKDSLDVNISAGTLSRRLRDAGLVSYVALRKLLLNYLAKKRRMVWCYERRNWMKEAW